MRCLLFGLRLVSNSFQTIRAVCTSWIPSSRIPSVSSCPARMRIRWEKRVFLCYWMRIKKTNDEFDDGLFYVDRRLEFFFFSILIHRMDVSLVLSSSKVENFPFFNELTIYGTIACRWQNASQINYYVNVRTWIFFTNTFISVSKWNIYRDETNAEIGPN